MILFAIFYISVKIYFAVKNRYIKNIYILGNVYNIYNCKN